MQLSAPDVYYDDRDVPHTAQGDIYAGIPFVHATLLTSAFEAAGGRKRPDAREPDLGVVTSHQGLGVVLHYTCGITAQPEGTEGYSHEYRLMAPIVSLRTLKGWKLGNNELRKIRDGYTIQGFMYLPRSNRSSSTTPTSRTTSGLAMPLHCSTARRRSARRSLTSSRGSHDSHRTRLASWMP